MGNLPPPIGKYECVEYLGGGMSDVYRARDTVLGRTVAVKILKHDADADAKARFLQEARIAGGIVHESIMHVYDYGEHEGRTFMVMEFLQGSSLTDAIRQNRTGSVSDRLRTAVEIARALQFVHNRGIVHRDLKPHNIQILPSGRIKLMDFGVARQEDSNLTRTGETLGTPHYMAPEQLSGKPITGQADVYAFGIVLFEIFTGKRPLQGSTWERLFFQILHEPLDLEPLRLVGAPESVVRLVERCTAKSPDQRPQGFSAVAEEIEAILEDPDRKPLPEAPTRIMAVPPQPPPPKKQSKALLPRWAAAFGAMALAVGAWGLWTVSSRPNVAQPPPASTAPVPTATPASVAVDTPIVKKTLRPAPTPAAERATIKTTPAPVAPAPTATPTPTPTPTPVPADPRLAQLEAWERISGSRDPVVFEEFRRRFPAGPLAEQATRMAEQLEWDRVRSAPEPNALRSFASRHPNGVFAGQAAARLREIEAREAEAHRPEPPKPPPEAAKAPVLDQKETGKRAIRDLLRRYADAYQAKNVQAIREMRPSLSRKEIGDIQEFFKSVREVQLDIQPLAEPEINGDAAALPCKYNLQFKDKSGTQMGSPETVTFRFQRAVNAGWVIASTR